MADDSLLSRRRFLAASLAAAAAACSGDDTTAAPDPTATVGATPTPTATPDPTVTPAPTATPEPTPTPEPVEVPDVPPSPIEGDPFGLGVASGDPDDTSVILWTRFVSPDGTGIPDGDHPVLWEVATTESFSTIVAAGIAPAVGALGHSVHVEAAGLRPDTGYAYRFRVGDHTSTVGTTRTFPAPETSPTRVRFGFSSCQHIQVGYYVAHRHLATSGLDFFVWLGDYIYERNARSSVIAADRRHTGGEAVDLAGYRNRYEQYRRDPDLQAHHAAHPWIVTWDDHEVDGNYANDLSQNNDPRDAFLARRADAYQVWYEHMPVRLDPPEGPDIEIHRSFRWGDLMELFALDTRQFRDPPPTDGDFLSFGGLVDPALPIRTLSPDALDPERTVLGADQERWLLDGMATTGARWKVLAQSVVMQGFRLIPGADPPLINVDGWDGYSGNRSRLFQAMADDGVDNLVVLAGDLHLSIAGDVRIDPFDDTSPIVAAEFVSSSISSTLGRITTAAEAIAPIANDQMRHFDTRRGYVICEIDPDQATGIFMAVDATNPNSDAVEIARFGALDGIPGLA